MHLFQCIKVTGMNTEKSGDEKTIRTSDLKTRIDGKFGTNGCVACRNFRHFESAASGQHFDRIDSFGSCPALSQINPYSLRTQFWVAAPSLATRGCVLLEVVAFIRHFALGGGTLTRFDV
uniref:(northern house mosquito) hypothetical protein n=1 Tax=Culex pipiens TaxID=7175 RepID=A0A8D8CLJ8_CULPI